MINEVAQTARKESKYEEALSIDYKVMDELFYVIETLQERLGPALRSDARCEDGAKIANCEEPNSDCFIVNEIRNRTKRTTGLSAKIADIITRLEI